MPPLVVPNHRGTSCRVILGMEAVFRTLSAFELLYLIYLKNITNLKSETFWKKFSKLFQNQQLFLGEEKLEVLIPVTSLQCVLIRGLNTILTLDSS